MSKYMSTLLVVLGIIGGGMCARHSYMNTPRSPDGGASHVDNACIIDSRPHVGLEDFKRNLDWCYAQHQIILAREGK